MKKYILFTMVVLGALISCQDYLDFPPEGEVPQDEFFKTQDDAQKAVNAMYGYLRSWDISAFNYLILGSLPSDEIMKGSEPGDGSWANEYDNFQFSKTEVQILDFWKSRYQGINFSNQVLKNVPDIEMSPEIRKRMIAEAKFLRAFHYFHLVRAFGGVPLIDKIPAGPERAVRATVEETWDFIETNLRDAIPDLPATVPPAEYGRTTSWAAKGLLAKVLMYEEDWTECKAVSDDIINNGPYSLYPDFYALFRLEQEFCSESLFEIVATQVPGESTLSNCQFAQVQGVRAQFDAWGWYTPTDILADAFDAAGDTIRKKVTIQYMGDITEDNDTIQGIAVMEGVDIPRYNGKAYVPSRIPTDGRYGSDQNVRILRYADILLINAEAAIHEGGDAATPLNEVRARANLDPIAGPTIEDIWEERRLELAGEQDRYWDLLRTGRAAAVLAGDGFETGKHELYPIPHTEVKQSGGSLQQNPGW